MMSGLCCRFGCSYLSMRHVKYDTVTKKQLTHVLQQVCCRGRFFTSLFCQDGYTYADCCGSTIAPDCFPGRDAQEWVKDGFLSVAFPGLKKRCLSYMFCWQLDFLIQHRIQKHLTFTAMILRDIKPQALVFGMLWQRLVLFQLLKKV